MATLSPWLTQKFYLADGVTPNAGGKIFTYEAGTSTKKPSYTSRSGAVNTNPIILNAAGECNLWLEYGGYKIVNAPSTDTDPPAAAIKTWDDVNQPDSEDILHGTAQSIADMKQFDEGFFDTVNVLGYYSANGVGASFYRWDGNSTASDNGGTVIAPTVSDGTGRWLLTQTEEVRISQFGARGASSVEDTAALVAAVTAYASSDVRLIIDVNVLFNADLNIKTTAPNLCIASTDGGKITLSSGKTLTLGKIDVASPSFFMGTGTYALSSDSCEVVDCAWFGASVSLADNTQPINSALTAAASTSAFKPGVVRLGSGTYTHLNPIVLPQRNIIFEGVGAGSTHLKYTGTTFQNGVEINTGGEGYIKVREMELQCTGKGKYGLYATSINEASEINLSIRDYTGMFKIESGYLSDVNIRAQASAWDALTTLGITQANWLTVYGTDCAPMWLGSMNACNVTVKSYRVGSIIQGGVTPFAEMYIQSTTGMNLNTPNFEWGFGTGSNPGDVSYDSFEHNSVTYALRTTSILYLKYVAANINGMRVETSRFNNIIKTKGECNVIIDGLDDYQNYSVGDRFVIESAHDLLCRAYKATDARSSGVLFKNTDSGISAQQGFILDQCNMVYGKRYTQSVANGGPNDDADNVIDTYAFTTTEKLGCADDIARTYGVDRLYIPKILTGYAVTSGSMTNVPGNRYSLGEAGSIGDYIQVTPGVMMLESGKIVDSKRGTAAVLTTGLQVVHRLRPITASKWYRVFINRAGAPYLVEYASDPVATPEGNWIAGFQTNGSTQITGLANNLRLGYTGNYVNNSLFADLNGTAAPTTGYWRKGDKIRNTNVSADNILDWYCTTAGTSGTWTPNYNVSQRYSGTLNSQTTTVGNVGVGIDDLLTYTLPAGTLSTNGDYIKFIAWGEFAANANNKQIVVSFDTHQLFATTALAFNGASWRIEGTISRISATTQRGSIAWQSSSALLSSSAGTSNPARTLANALILKLTGEATANDDIVQRGMIVEFCAGS